MSRRKDGRFAKGNKEGGRTKGSKNTKTKDWEEMREFIKSDLVPNYVDKVKQMMDSADERIVVQGMDKMLHILEYFAPKLGRTELVGDGGDEVAIKVTFEEEPE